MSVPQVADATAPAAELTLPTVPAPGRPARPEPAPPAPDRTGPRYALSLAVILQILISAGDGLAMVALASRVYQTSHASWAVAAVFLAVTVPITALAPAAGLLLDRLSPRPVLVAAAAAETAVALALTRLTGTGAILGLSLGFGLCAALLQPGLGVIVPQLAGRTGVTRANGYLQAATWGGFTVGPLLAGVLTAAGGTGLALGAVAAVYGLGAIGLRALPLAAGPAGLAGGPAAPGATMAILAYRRISPRFPAWPAISPRRRYSAWSRPIPPASPAWNSRTRGSSFWTQRASRCGPSP